MENQYSVAAFEKQGYVVIRNFLSEEMLALLREDYLSAKLSTSKNYTMPIASPSALQQMGDPVKKVRQCISEQTNTPFIDKFFIAVYFATRKNINFSWHMDYEDYFVFQRLYHSLNFYIPIIKPDKKQSNLSIVPLDRLREACPELAEKLMNSGAKMFSYDEKNNRSFMVDSLDRGEPEAYDFNIKELAVTPELEAGDLLLFRGNMIHHTQDANTDRVALSIRYHYSQDEVDLDNYLDMTAHKLFIMLNNAGYYRNALLYLLKASCPITFEENYDQMISKTYPGHRFLITKTNEKKWEIYYVDLSGKLNILDLNHLVKLDEHIQSGSIGEFLAERESLAISELSESEVFEMKKKLRPWLVRCSREYNKLKEAPKIKCTVGEMIDYIHAHGSIKIT